MGWGLGRLGALWFSRTSSPLASHRILQSFVSVSAPSCPSPRRHPDCLPCDIGAGLLAPCFLSCGVRRAFLRTDVCFFEGLWRGGKRFTSQGLEDSGDFWRHSHCLLSQNHPLIDFVERLSIGGPPSMLSVYDDLDILQIDIACSALGIIGNPSPLLPPCLPGICCFLVSH